MRDRERSLGLAQPTEELVFEGKGTVWEALLWGWGSSLGQQQGDCLCDTILFCMVPVGDK